jgi:hypothetical protein
MSEFSDFPNNPDELLRKIHNAIEAEDKKSEPAPTVADSQLYNRLCWLFDITERRYPECMTGSFDNQPTVELVDIGAFGTPEDYDPDTALYYRISQQDISQPDDEALITRYVITETDRLVHGTGEEVIFNRLFDGEADHIIGPMEQELIDKAYAIISNPFLYYRAHLEELRIVKFRRMRRARRVGREVVKYKRPNKS